MKEKRESGFTLIELLIVVAIIAILAAIAIPNFLAAQVRAKVSRAKANMRTAATALESYYVDNNSYPGAYPSGSGWNQMTWAVPLFVTTPISYITSVPKDDFDSYQGLGPFTIPIKYRIAGWGYNNTATAPAQSPVLGANATFCVNVGSGLAPDDVFFSTREANNTNIQWCLFSVGPGHSLTGGGYYSDNGSNYPQPHRLWYDPTNGTVSQGYVARESGGVSSP